MSLLVVTATLGHSPWLEEAVRSVAAASPDCRHVLVAPWPEVPRLRRRFPELQVLPEPGGGMYAAINYGLANAGAWDAFTYLNDDDLLLPPFAGVLRCMQRVLRESAVAYGRVRLIDTRGRRIGSVPVSPFGWLSRALYEQGIEPVFQQGTVVTRKAFNELAGFEPTLRYCGDSDFLSRAALSGIRFIRVRGGEVAAFRLRDAQLSKQSAEMARERDLIGRKRFDSGRRLGWRQAVARALFRTANVSLYVERLLRHGWISGRELNERGS